MKYNMKNIGVFLCAMFLLITKNASSQTCCENNNPWIIGFGINVIYDSGEKVSGFLDFNENYHFSNPFRLSIEKRFKDDFGFEISGTSNRYLEGKSINGLTVQEDISFLGLEGVFKYYITNRYLNIYRAIYEGYIGSGLGISFFDNTGATYANLNFGVNYYLSESIYLNGQVNGNFSISNNDNVVGSNYIQYNLGLIIKLSDNDFN